MNQFEPQVQRSLAGSGKGMCFTYEEAMSFVWTTYPEISYMAQLWNLVHSFNVTLGLWSTIVSTAFSRMVMVPQLESVLLWQPPVSFEGYFPELDVELGLCCIGGTFCLLLSLVCCPASHRLILEINSIPNSLPT
jgi:hypothetical protein